MIKVANLVRLLEKDEKGLYKKQGQKTVVRKGMKILASSVEEKEGNYQDSGLIYEVDEKATEEWYKSKEKPAKTSKTKKTEDAEN